MLKTIVLNTHEISNLYGSALGMLVNGCIYILIFILLNFTSCNLSLVFFKILHGCLYYGKIRRVIRDELIMFYFFLPTSSR